MSAGKGWSTLCCERLPSRRSQASKMDKPNVSFEQLSSWEWGKLLLWEPPFSLFNFPTRRKTPLERQKWMQLINRSPSGVKLRSPKKCSRDLIGTFRWWQVDWRKSHREPGLRCQKKGRACISPVAPTICYHKGGKPLRFLNMELLVVVQLTNKQDYINHSDCTWRSILQAWSPPNWGVKSIFNIAIPYCIMHCIARRESPWRSG